MLSGFSCFRMSSGCMTNQKDDLQALSIKAKNIDYVAGWYYKAAELMYDTKIITSFVSTNSITQGEQVSAIWKPLYTKYDVNIRFAYRTFVM